MKCLTPDELLCFAMEPLEQENSSAALHLMQCPECRANYELALECLADDDNVITAADEAAADEAAAELTGSLWKKFYSYLEKVSGTLSAPGNIFKSAPSGFLRPAPAMQFAAASRESAGVKHSLENDEVKFTFESYAAPGSGHYWKMQMTMPRIFSGSALISMKVTGDNGAALDGTLDFLNQKTAFNCGCAHVTFKTFLENKGCKEISFAPQNGSASPGRLKFLPEALQ